MTRSEKLCEGSLSTSLLDEVNRSDAAQTFIILTESRKQTTFAVGKPLQRDDMPVLGLEPVAIDEKFEIWQKRRSKWQVRWVDQSPVSHDCGSFVECGPTIMPHSKKYLDET